MYRASIQIFLPFFGSPLPLPRRDFLSSSLLLGLVGAAEVPLTISPLSLRESPLPESLEEFFLSLRLAFALRRASWMLLLEEDSQLPLISLLMFLLAITALPLSSSPDTKESLRSSASVELQERTGERGLEFLLWSSSLCARKRHALFQLVLTRTNSTNRYLQHTTRKKLLIHLKIYPTSKYSKLCTQFLFADTR